MTYQPAHGQRRAFNSARPITDKNFGTEVEQPYPTPLRYTPKSASARLRFFGDIVKVFGAVSIQERMEIYAAFGRGTTHDQIIRTLAFKRDEARHARSFG